MLYFMCINMFLNKNVLFVIIDGKVCKEVYKSSVLYCLIDFMLLI